MFEVCKHVRSDQVLETLPVIILSADSELKTTALAAGADRFVTKPFELHGLGCPVEELLARPGFWGHR